MKRGLLTLKRRGFRIVPLIGAQSVQARKEIGGRRRANDAIAAGSF
jgi:hypothetical protein